MCSNRCRKVAGLMALVISLGMNVPVASQTLGTDREAISKDCYTLLQYVRWPNYRADGDITSPFLVSVCGDTTLVRLLREGRSVASINGRTLKIAALGDIADTVAPQVLILGSGTPDSTTALIERFQDKPVLTILISEKPVKSGAILTLSQGDSPKELSAQLDVDRGAAKRSGVNLSPRLANLEVPQKQ